MRIGHRGGVTHVMRWGGEANIGLGFPMFAPLQRSALIHTNEFKSQLLGILYLRITEIGNDIAISLLVLAIISIIYYINVP